MYALYSKGQLEIKESIERFMDVEQKNPQPQNCGPKLHNSQLPMKNVFYGKLVMWFLDQTRLLGKFALKGLLHILFCRLKQITHKIYYAEEKLAQKLLELSSFVTNLSKLKSNLF